MRGRCFLVTNRISFNDRKKLLELNLLNVATHTWERKLIYCSVDTICYVRNAIGGEIYSGAMYESNAANMTNL